MQQTRRSKNIGGRCVCVIGSPSLQTELHHLSENAPSPKYVTGTIMTFTSVFNKGWATLSPRTFRAAL